MPNSHRGNRARNAPPPRPSFGRGPQSFGRGQQSSGRGQQFTSHGQQSSGYQNQQSSGRGQQSSGRGQNYSGLQGRIARYMDFRDELRQYEEVISSRAQQPTYENNSRRDQGQPQATTGGRGRGRATTSGGGRGKDTTSERAASPSDKVWIPLDQDELKRRLDQDASTVPRLPQNRSTIWHSHCGQMHAPEFCQGPLIQGVLHTCALCGGPNHLTEACEYWRLVSDDGSSLEKYLHVYARQGLAPLASKKDFSKVVDITGFRPPLCPNSAALYENAQYDLDRKAGKSSYFLRFNYNALRPLWTEVESLPKDDPCLGKWSQLGPLPNVDAPWVWEEYLSADHATPYNPNWTLFSNEGVEVPANRVRLCHFRRWVTGTEDLLAKSKNSKQKRGRSPEAAESSHGVPKRVRSHKNRDYDPMEDVQYDAPLDALEEKPIRERVKSAVALAIVEAMWESRVQYKPVDCGGDGEFAGYRADGIRLLCRRRFTHHPKVQIGIEIDARLLSIRKRAHENATRDAKLLKIANEKEIENQFPFPVTMMDRYLECQECWQLEYKGAFTDQEIGSGLRFYEQNPFASPSWVQDMLDTYSDDKEEQY
ncbi:hypothetical protein PFICI_11840 [Pestalotiopsis fici W106-1]|uniref:Uncharacterized protein n=1 Tax=Pestalotiopsis fici (strain W106-1 / CGMCC3.15140) TaxID=1229662 RepID=W3WRH2_PESFW|nr:uncharacterized protein PFICI_11840 [Pestalotiopsis fici W106-1]ETS76453.1 hypothetical protein PFICI_11840 [Pestalotiopsis fici W106-1]